MFNFIKFDTGMPKNIPANIHLQLFSDHVVMWLQIGRKFAKPNFLHKQKGVVNLSYICLSDVKYFALGQGCVIDIDLKRMTLVPRLLLETVECGGGSPGNLGT